MTIHGGRNYIGFFAVAAAALVLACCARQPHTFGRPRVAATMTIPIGQSDTNLDSLRSEIEALPFSGAGHTRKRKAQGANLGISVTIRPVGDSRSIDSASGPATPTIVAWIQNQNLLMSTENPVFKPKNQAQYLVQIYRDPSTSESKYQIIEVPSSSRGTVSAIMTGVLVPCYHPAWPYPDADFKSCDGFHEVAVSQSRTRSGYAQTSMRGSFFREASYQQPDFIGRDAFIFDPTWIACNAGCCTLAGTN
jgi:hypothetical protein